MTRWATLTSALLVSAFAMAGTLPPDSLAAAGSRCSTARPSATGTTPGRPTGGSRTARSSPTRRPDKGTAPSRHQGLKYKDFQIYAEFWVNDDANSGIFFRRPRHPKKITDETAYEVNIFDERPDPTFGTGAIVNVAKSQSDAKAGGKWNTYEFTQGRRCTVVLNGQKTVDLHNGMFEEGPFTLQYGSGVIKFRKVAVKPL